MTFSDFPTSYAAPLIFDTSVLINMRASQHAVPIIDALPNEILVPQPVAEELSHQTSEFNCEAQFLDSLLLTRRAQMVQLDGGERSVFEDLVSGDKSIGDGEAATIAVAANRNLVAVIDDRRGRNRARELVAEIALAWSIDLFLHPMVSSVLNSSTLSESVFFALRDGRMRIHSRYIDRVVKIVGAERALECPCLPGYKSRRAEWEVWIRKHQAT